jgi:hypothetical protein
MVRFSDMLGGNEDARETRASVAPRHRGDESPEPEPAEPAAAAAPDENAETETETETAPDDPAPAESPEAVLDRLTQYASSARASDPPPPEATAPEPADNAEPLTSAGDDLLPHPKGEKGKRRKK